MPVRKSNALGEKALRKFDSVNPVAFHLHDDEGNQQIYILNDQSPGRTHHLVLFNHSGKILKFQPAEDKVPGPLNCHLELRFRPGTLDLDHLSWINPGTAGWRMATSEEEYEDTGAGQVKDGIHDGTVSLYLLYTAGELTFKPGSAQVIILHLMKAAIPGGSRGSRVELRYFSDGKTLFRSSSEGVLHRRQGRLQIINQRGKKELPVVAAFDGGSTVLNNGETANHLVLQVSNFLHNATIPLNGHDHDNPTKFILSFDTSEEQAAWALCDPDNAAAIDVDLHFEARDGIDWHIRPELQGNSPQWVITLKDDLPLRVGEFFHLHVDGLKSSMPSGFTNLYLLYQNIPGYWDGRFEVPIEKSPLKFADEKESPDHRSDGRFVQQSKIGIGNLEPADTLDVNGGIESESLYLRNGDYTEEARKRANYEKTFFPLLVNGGIKANGAIFTDNSEKSLDGFTSGLTLYTGGNAKINGQLSTRDLEVTGNLKVTGSLSDSLGSLLPKGAIIMWSGEKIPDGWKLCDGKNGRPDLRGRFVVGQHPGKGDYNKPGKKGGRENVTLTTQQMPKHDHGGTLTTDKKGAHQHYLAKNKSGSSGLNSSNSLAHHSDEGNYEEYKLRSVSGNANVGRTNSAGAHSHQLTVKSEGGDKAHENRPPYYVLAFIIKA